MQYTPETFRSSIFVSDGMILHPPVRHSPAVFELSHAEGLSEAAKLFRASLEMSHAGDSREFIPAGGVSPLWLPPRFVAAFWTQ